MRQSIQRILVPALLACLAIGLRAQDFDPATRAQGWAHQDRDSSFMFFDPTARALVTWDRSFGITGSVPIGSLGEVPEKWLPDKYNNAWVIAGTSLALVGKDGKVMRREKLPLEVGDVAWDGLNGFVLSYRTPQPYLEMRDYRNADVLWTYGTKPGKGATAVGALHHVMMRVASGASTVLLSEGGTLAFTLLEGAKGKPLGQMRFEFSGGMPPVPDTSKGDPGPMCLWFGKNVAFAAIPAEQLPANLGIASGVVLARMDLASSTIELIPTQLSPANRFIGVVDKDALFIAPQGGLVVVPVK